MKNEAVRYKKEKGERTEEKEKGRVIFLLI